MDDEADANGTSNIGQGAGSKDIQSPLSMAGAVEAQPETQGVFERLNSEIEPVASSEDVGLTLSEGSPRISHGRRHRTFTGPRAVVNITAPPLVVPTEFHRLSCLASTGTDQARPQPRSGQHAQHRQIGTPALC